MNRRVAFILLTIFALVLMTSECPASSEASVLFEKAKFTMVTKGDLEGAIKLFSEIIEQHPGDREYAAKSQLYIGLCYEKQGKEQAQKAYQKVIQEYSDQREVAAEARTRLAALERPVSAPTERGMVVRSVLVDRNVGGLGEISPDGRFISYVDWDTGDLAIREIATGKKRRLTNKGSWEESNEFAEFSRWSPDSKQIVYNWWNEQEKVYDLRIIGLDGSKPRILYSNAEEVDHAQAEDWFPDGRQVLALFGKKDSTLQIVSVSTQDRSRRVIKVLGQTYPRKTWSWSSWPKHMSLSPDGRYIVYDLTPEEGSSNHDIFLLASDGSREIPLIEHPAHDFVLGWAPDGKRILFASDRTGTLGFWLIRVEEGKPQGAPELVKLNMGQIWPMGFTRKGSFCYCVLQERNDIYIAELDPETGEVLVPPEKAIKIFEGNNLLPDYSPDGKYLAYISRRGAPFSFRRNDVGDVLCVRSLETGKDHELFPQGLKRFGYPCWSPDSRSIFVVNWATQKDSMGIYRIDAQTGEVIPVVTTELGGIGGHECSHDGKAIFLVREDRENKLYKIVVRDFESGKETEIYRAPLVGNKRPRKLSQSPDGRWVSFIENLWTQKFALKIIPATGGEPRELEILGQRDYKPTDYSWTADGRYILLSINYKLQPGPDWKWGLLRVPVEGGKTLILDMEMKQFIHVSAHPDGRRIAFSSEGTARKLPEVWVMENFLPTE